MHKKTEILLKQISVKEIEFCKLLESPLKEANEGKNSLLFLVSELNNFDKVKIPEINDELYNIASEIKEMKKTIYGTEEKEDSISGKFIEYCKEFSDVNNNNRRGTKKLAHLLSNVLQLNKKE